MKRVFSARRQAIKIDRKVIVIVLVMIIMIEGHPSKIVRADRMVIIKTGSILNSTKSFRGNSRNPELSTTISTKPKQWRPSRKNKVKDSHTSISNSLSPNNPSSLALKRPSKLQTQSRQSIAFQKPRGSVC